MTGYNWDGFAPADDDAPTSADLPPDDSGGLDDPATGQYHVAARMIATRPGRHMYVPGVGWYVYDGRRWDDGGGLAEKLTERAVIDTARRMITDAAHTGDKQQRDALLRLGHRTLSSDTQVRGTVAMATRHPDVLVSVAELDAHPYHLNVANGTLDLLTSRLAPHDPADRHTKVTAAEYRPGIVGEAWPRFVADALGDPELIAAVQQLVGGPGCMGKVLDHLFPVIYGPSGSGKSTFLNATGDALGDYAIHAEPDLVMRRAGAHPTGLTDLMGVRLAAVSESDHGRRLDAAVMKRLSGGDKIRARRMRADFIEFTPSHLLLLVTNHLPQMPTGDDPAVWRRVRIIPFDRPPAKADKRLPERLTDERDAVLTWMLDGFADYWTGGHEIPWPESVLAATADYRSGSDLLGQWLDDSSARVDPSAATEPIGSVYKRWRAWLERNAPDTRPGRVQDLLRSLRERGEIVRAGTSRNGGSVLAGRMFYATEDDETPVWTP